MLPEGFAAKYQQLLGAEAAPFLASFQKVGYKGFRLNPLKPNYQAVHLDLHQPVPQTKWGYYGAVKGRQVDHQAGYVYSQEPSAMLVGAVAAPQPGERVLDLCAAPGGKTTHLAGFMRQQGLLVANEIMPKRAKILAENVERFGITNAVITNETPARLAQHFPSFFDRILVDAPCSGEGMFRKDPGAKKYWTPEYPLDCAKRQREILKATMQMLRPGGELIYSTCTFSPEEDEQIVAWLLQNYAVSVVPIKRGPGMSAGRPEWADHNPALAGTLRLFPHLFAGEGHFMAKLRLATNDAAPVTVKPAKTKRHSKRVLPALTKEQQALWQDFAQTTLLTTQYAHLLVHREHLFAQPEAVVLQGLKVVRPGLPLGEFKRNRFEPAYALALTLNTAKQVLALTAAEYTKYVHGETFTTTTPGKGWYLLRYQEKTVGFGKLTNGTMKNFFPKGLRFVADIADD
ncbi:RsmF rRNA methyltransferase first C-terminal domain-containing protein [Loigolactobacillus binensis]|uniref:RsmF rRNA methyltransferase first C-terminal domain-containing protein n=1 Tax=Loigolactobacillus binensis TaxID=2559922 RepID=A0ABW3EC91_9LACO|nr:RsmF rRNA methyltransferase first C-terminal domain-containing protein [Loigolactobacillus binensis]